MKFSSEAIRGPKNPRWRGGRTVTAKGYSQITAGAWRNWLEHRALVAHLLAHNEISPAVMPREIPDGWVVHHMDGNRRHNCPHNLLLSPGAFHTYSGNSNGKHATLNDLPEELLEGAYRPWP